MPRTDAQKMVRPAGKGKLNSAKGGESEHMAEGGGAGSVRGTGAPRMNPMAEAVRLDRKLGRVDSVAFDVAQEKPSCSLGVRSEIGGKTGGQADGDSSGDVRGGADCSGAAGVGEGGSVESADSAENSDDSTCSESGGVAESSDSSSSSDGDGAPTIGDGEMLL